MQTVFEKMKHALQNKENPTLQYERQRSFSNSQDFKQSKEEIIDEIMSKIDVMLEEKALQKLVDMLNKIVK